MERRSFLRDWKALLLCPPTLLLLSSCGSWNPIKQVEVKTVQVERVIPTQQRPRPLKLSDITWYVVTDQNFDQFKKKYTKRNGEFLFYAFSVRDYETLSLNMAELQRYIGQQKQIIIYYEQAVEPKPKPEKGINDKPKK
jgi:hypothetical protein